MEEIVPSGDDRVLIVVAHPDDEILGAFALMSGFAAAGATLRLCILRPDDPIRLAVSREVSHRLKMSLTASSEVALNEGAGPGSRALVALIDALINEHRPTIIVTHGTFDGDHQEHQLVGRIATICWLRYVRSTLRRCRLLRMCPIASGLGFAPNAYFVADSSLDDRLQTLARLRAGVERWYLEPALSAEHLRASASLSGAEGVAYAELYEEDRRQALFPAHAS